MADSEVSGAIGSGTSSCFLFGACQVDWRRLARYYENNNDDEVGVGRKGWKRDTIGISLQN